MDPFEEFEFKPLTEGLGFHQRSSGDRGNSKIPSRPETTVSGTPSARVDFALEMMAPDTAETLNNNPQIQSPLPRKQPRSEAKLNHRESSIDLEPPLSNTVDEILKTLGERRKYDFDEKSKTKNFSQSSSTELSNFRSQNSNLSNHLSVNSSANSFSDLQNPAVVETFVPSQFEFSAALLDAMLIIAADLAAMIILLVVTKIDLFGNLLNADEDGVIFLGLAGMLATITWIYLVAHRLFLGFTPGEWVFDQRLGRPEQLGTPGYSMKVALRSLIVLATGFFLIPLSSMILRRDWLGRWMGVELVKKV